MTLTSIKEHALHIFPKHLYFLDGLATQCSN